jgi:hypothetical protein
MIKTALVLIFIVLFIPVVVFGAEGQPFKALQEQIDQLKTELQSIQTQLQNIQLTPGPPGATGATGATGAAGHSPVLTWLGDQIAIDGSVTGPHLRGPAGPAGSSPVLTWSGDQIAVNGVVTGPHLTGPAGVANGITTVLAGTVDAVGQKVTGGDWAIIYSGDLGNAHTYQLQLTSMTGPVRPQCIVHVNNPLSIPLPYTHTPSFEYTWTYPVPGAWAFTLQLAYGDYEDWLYHPYTSTFDFICVQ